MSPEMMRRFRESNKMSLPGPGEMNSEINEDVVIGREPLTDLIEHDDHFTVTMELPGVEKKDINLETTDDELEVSVDTPLRKYYKKLHLPCEIDSGTISASFNNGVLDVNIKQLKPKSKKGKKIKIE